MPVNSPVTPTPSEGFAHIPPSPVNISLGYSTNTTHPRVPDATVGHAIPASGAQVGRNTGGTAHPQPRSAPALQPSKDPSGPYRYLSQLPARPEWNPGCVSEYRRQDSKRRTANAKDFPGAVSGFDSSRFCKPSARKPGSPIRTSPVKRSRFCRTEPTLTNCPTCQTSAVRPRLDTHRWPALA